MTELPIGTYVRPKEVALADEVGRDEGWIWRATIATHPERGEEIIYDVLHFQRGECRLGSCWASDVDMSGVGPVNRAGVRQTCRTLHRLLGMQRSRGNSSYSSWDQRMAQAIRPLEDVALGWVEDAVGAPA